MSFHYALVSAQGVLLKSSATHAPIAKIIATLSVLDSHRSLMPWHMRCSNQYYAVAPLIDLPFYVVLASADYSPDATLVLYSCASVTITLLHFDVGCVNIREGLVDEPQAKSH